MTTPKLTELHTPIAALPPTHLDTPPAGAQARKHLGGAAQGVAGTGLLGEALCYMGERIVICICSPGNGPQRWAHITCKRGIQLYHLHAGLETVEWEQRYVNGRPCQPRRSQSTHPNAYSHTMHVRASALTHLV